MGKLGIHLVGQVTHAPGDRGVRIQLIAQERAEQRIRWHGLGVGIVCIHLCDVARFHATLPGLGKIVGQPQVAHALGHVGWRIALARHHGAAGGFFVELIILRVYPGEVAFGQ